MEEEDRERKEGEGEGVRERLCCGSSTHKNYVSPLLPWKQQVEHNLCV